MTLLSHNEFGSHSYGEFEFSLESRALLAVADMNSVGEAGVSVSTGVLINSVVNSIGSSEVTPVAQAITYSSMEATGAANTVFDGSTIIYVYLGSLGSSVASFEGGLIKAAAFNAESISTSEFQWIDGFGFDINSQSHVAFITNSYFSSRVSIAGVSQSNPLAQALRNTALSSSSNAVAALKANAFANTGVFAEARGTGIFSAILVRVATLQSNGSTVFVPKFQGVIGSSLNSLGSSVNTYKGYASVNAALDIAGSSQVTVNAVRVMPGSFESNGLVTVTFKVGKQVSTTLPYAYDIVIRPYEDRGTSRPSEDRNVRWK